jgi:hypothetical protein
VKGEYTIRGGKEPVSGEYTCRARWEGRLEPDGDDFLLVHLKTEILEWKLREKAGPAGGETLLEAPDAPRPSLRLNYILKEGRDIDFYFEWEGIPVPLHASPPKITLELPRSWGRYDDLPAQRYGDFICGGSNRVVFPAADLSLRTPERTFSWEWRREQRLVENSRAFLVIQSHTVEAVVALIAH